MCTYYACVNILCSVLSICRPSCEYIYMLASINQLYIYA